MNQGVALILTVTEQFKLYQLIETGDKKMRERYRINKERNGIANNELPNSFFGLTVRTMSNNA